VLLLAKDLMEMAFEEGVDALEGGDGHFN
jgi:hypothetical protein